ncbi:MAG: hypothetical protein IPM34_11845 [Saprospiraceae bacterium]|nr:hypothetical protein [Saprospiraceae bacterium]
MIVVLGLMFASFSARTQENEPYVVKIQNGQVYCNTGDSIDVSPTTLQNSQMVFLLFHAEQDTIGMDPGLSIPGRYRALNLLKLFKDQDIKAFYSTPFRNNVLTLQPLLDSKKIDVVYYDQADIAALVKKIDHIYPESAMVVVHPQTLHKILSQLSGRELTYKVSGNLSEKLILLSRNKKSGTSLMRNFRYPIR